ncbi:MAG: UMP kinase [Candidatus Thorarchaeota archaeon]
MKLVIKIGGSLLFDQNHNFKLSQFANYAQVIRQLVNQNHNIILVIGGGILAKTLVERGKALGANRDAQDNLGIAATRVCAQLMITALNDITYPTPITSEEELMHLQDNGRLLVLGGLQPGQSTNAVAARVAELTNSEILINLTDVDGVYDKDPKESPDAKLLHELSLNQLGKIVASLASDPGTYPLFDKRALGIVERAKVEIWFINGTDAENLLHAVKEGKIGTRITTE